MITSDSPEIGEYWDKCCKEKGIDSKSQYHARSFGDPSLSPNIDMVANLTVTGNKRGTAHLRHDFEVNDVPMREVGDYWILLSADRAPLCLLRITKIEIKPFNEVDEVFAASEAEGDLSLDYWATVHRRYFRKQCEKWDLDWREDLPTVCENFEMIFNEPA